jgi:hypothetical protein
MLAGRVDGVCADDHICKRNAGSNQTLCAGSSDGISADARSPIHLPSRKSPLWLEILKRTAPGLDELPREMANRSRLFMYRSRHQGRGSSLQPAPCRTRAVLCITAILIRPYTGSTTASPTMNGRGRKTPDNRHDDVR